MDDSGTELEEWALHLGQAARRHGRQARNGQHKHPCPYHENKLDFLPQFMLNLISAILMCATSQKWQADLKRPSID
eukprot:scaffold650622_cov48-Prasinocladus_malaysianus.AAC.1